MATAAEQEGVLGLLVNDAHGLCVTAQGDLAGSTKTSGFFTSMADHAISLARVDQASDDEGDDEEEDEVLPIVRLETSTRSLVITQFASEGTERTLVVSTPLPTAE